MTVLLFWIAVAALVGLFAAKRRNRDGVGWFLLSLIVPPILTFPLVAILDTKPPRPARSTPKLSASGWALVLGGSFLAIAVVALLMAVLVAYA